MTLEMRMTNPLDKYKGEGIGKSDIKKRVKLLKGYSFQKVFYQFKYCIDWYEQHRNDEMTLDVMIKKNFKEAYTPFEINHFVENTSKEASGDPETFGVFLSQLIGNSFRRGHNNFVLKSSENLEYLMLEGKAKMPLNVIIYGKKMYNLMVKHANLELHGDLKTLCLDTPSNYSAITVYGNVEDCGADSHHMLINVLGTLGELCSMKNSVIYVEKFSPNSDLGFPEKCTFITKYRETYDSILKHFAETYASKGGKSKAGNKVVLQDKKGRIIEACHDA